MSDADKTREQLIREVAELRRQAALLDRPLQERQWLVQQQVREEVWRMRRTDDIENVLEAVGDGLTTLEVPFLYCGVNFVDASVEPPAVTAYSMRQKGPGKRWANMEGGVILDFWRGQDLVYRRDIKTDDPYGEHPQLPAIRSVVDAPFSHGTLAISSPKPDALALVQ